MVFEVGVEQLIQNVAAACGQAFADMLAGVFGGDQTADVDEAQERLGIPLVQPVLIGAAGLELGQLLVGIIDEGGQLGAGRLRDGISQHDIDFFADDAGRRVQDVDKSLILAVQVTHKVFRPLGQLEQSLCADDLAGCCRLRGVIPRQQGQIFQVVSDLLIFSAHSVLPKLCSILSSHEIFNHSIPQLRPKMV